jgi:hypothetical protein
MHSEASPEPKKIKTSQILPPNPSKHLSSSAAPRKSSNILQIILILNFSDCSSQSFLHAPVFDGGFFSSRHALIVNSD